MEVQNDGTFRLRNFVRGCARYRWMVAAIFFVSVLAALLVAFLTTPVYRGHVLMMPAKQATQPSLADLAGPLGGLTAQLGLGRAPADDLQEGLATLTSFVIPCVIVSNVRVALSRAERERLMQLWQFRRLGEELIGARAA